MYTLPKKAEGVYDHRTHKTNLSNTEIAFQIKQSHVLHKYMTTLIMRKFHVRGLGTACSTSPGTGLASGGTSLSAKYIIVCTM